MNGSNYYENNDNVIVYGSTGKCANHMSIPKVRPIVIDSVSGEKGSGLDIKSLYNNDVIDLQDMAEGSFIGQKEDTKDLVTEDRSDSSMNDYDNDDVAVSTISYANLPWWKHPRVKKNWRIVVGSIALSVIGINAQSLVFIIAGIISFIPGAYHVVYIYCAVKGKHGYSFHHLPILK